MESKALRESLHFYNPWWETGRVPLELLKDYQRPVLKALVSYLSLDRIIILKGPRRTGKTTLFYQLVDRLLKQGTPAKDILFLSFDDIKIRLDLDEILKAYQEVNKRLIKEGRLIYVLLDEVHFLENWQSHVKKYFDRKYPMKFLVSGSAATLVRKGTESLTGRTIEETIYPFSFYEFLGHRSRNERMMEEVDNLRRGFVPFEMVDTSELIPYDTEIKIAFEEFLGKGGFPNLFGIEEALLWKRLVREDIVEKVIYRDLVELYDIKKPEVLEKLFLYLVDTTSGLLNVTNISNSLGLSREFTEKYLLYLEQALLIKRLSKFSKSIEKTIRSTQKVHLLDTGLVNAFSKIEIGKILESLVASHLVRCAGAKVYYFREKYEVDIVFEVGKDVFPIEIKYKDAFSKRDLSGLIGFNKKFKTKTSVLVTRDLLKEETENGMKIVYFPAWLFSLLL
jgi:uncharacterized protein